MTKKTSMQFAEALGSRLTELRAKLQLRKPAMAQKMGVCERVYRRYEAGEQVPGSDKLVALLDDLRELNPQWLLEGNGRMFQDSEQSQLQKLVSELMDGDPAIRQIFLLLKTLEPDDLQDILHHVRERKNLRELHTELRSMMSRMERPVPVKTGEQQVERSGSVLE